MLNMARSTSVWQSLIISMFCNSTGNPDCSAVRLTQTAFEAEFIKAPMTSFPFFSQACQCHDYNLRCHGCATVQDTKGWWNILRSLPRSRACSVLNKQNKTDQLRTQRTRISSLVWDLKLAKVCKSPQQRIWGFEGFWVFLKFWKSATEHHHPHCTFSLVTCIIHEVRRSVLIRGDRWASQRCAARWWRVMHQRSTALLTSLIVHFLSGRSRLLEHSLFAIVYLHRWI